MRKKNFKRHCEKCVIAKFSEVCRTYDTIQYAYADVLQASDEVKEIRCNVPLDRIDIGEYHYICQKALLRYSIIRKSQEQYWAREIV